jgi:predicted O-linked N-acetylglucosamine transferase (SPINDLY family)
MFARRAAPVQVTYLGYPDTTGVRAIDYRLTDGRADPAGESDAMNVERLYRLPRTAWCYRPSADAPAVSEPPAETNGFVTFASFNAVPKLNPPTIELWAELLKRIPDARLLLKALGFVDRLTRERVANDFAALGISAAERLEILPTFPAMAEHLKTYGRVDVALDPSPYNGTTTTCEALWMGVPVVTLSGPTHASRVGASLLNNVGLGELIASNPDEFLRIAVELAADRRRLAQLRAGLRERMARSPLTDERGVTRDIESAYRAMWKEWCRT